MDQLINTFQTLTVDDKSISLPFDVWSVLFPFLPCSSTNDLCLVSKYFFHVIWHCTKRIVIGRNFLDFDRRNDVFDFFEYLKGMKDVYAFNRHVSVVVKSVLSERFEDLAFLKMDEVVISGNKLNERSLEGWENLGMHTLRFISCDVCDEALDIISRIQSLTHVDFSFSTVSDKFCEYIALLPNINTLVVDGVTSLKKTDFASISEFVSLTDLRMGGTRIIDKELKNFSDMTQLKSLVLSNTPITDTGLQYLSTLVNLEHLDMSFCSGIDDISSIAENCPKISSLKLNTIENSVLALVQHLCQLKKLSLHACGNDSTLFQLSLLPQLESLEIKYNYEITQKGIMYLKDCPTLRHLEISFVKLDDTELFPCLSNLGQLESLTVSSLNATSSSFVHLSTLMNLRILNISKCTMINTGVVQQVGKMKNLMQLALPSNISQAELVHLDSLQLSSLKLNCPITTRKWLGNRYPYLTISSLETLYSM